MKLFLLIVSSVLAAQESWEPNPFILSRGEFSASAMASFLVNANPRVDAEFAMTLAEIYVDEASLESVNHDIAWVQMLLETSFLRFGGQVSSWQNNFAGLGALDGGNPGLSFDDPRTGVRAHIQHLRRYGGGEGHANPPVHNRGAYVRLGTAVTLYDLSGTWASDPEYHLRLLSLLYRMKEHADERNRPQEP